MEGENKDEYPRKLPNPEYAIHRDHYGADKNTPTKVYPMKHVGALGGLKWMTHQHRTM